MEDLNKLYPGAMPNIPMSKMKGAALDKKLAYLCKALNFIRDSWTKSHQQVAKFRYDSSGNMENTNVEQLVGKVLATLDCIIKAAKELFDMKEEDFTDFHSSHKISSHTSPAATASLSPLDHTDGSSKVGELASDSCTTTLGKPLRIEATQNETVAELKAEEITNENGQDDTNCKANAPLVPSKVSKQSIPPPPPPPVLSKGSMQSVPPPPPPLPPPVASKGSTQPVPPPPPLPPPVASKGSMQLVPQPPPVASKGSMQPVPPPPPLPPPVASKGSMQLVLQPPPVATEGSMQPVPPPLPPPVASKGSMQPVPPPPPPVPSKGSVPAPAPPLKRGPGPPPPPPPVPSKRSVAAPAPPLKRGPGPPPPPPPVPSKGSVAAPAPPLKGGPGAGPPPPPPPVPSKGSVVAPAPPLERGPGPPPPPPLGVVRAMNRKGAIAKLKRSTQMVNLFRDLKGKMEGTNEAVRSAHGKKKQIGGSTGGKQGMADTLAELTKRSSYFQQIEEDVKKHSKTIMELKVAINSFKAKDMVMLVKFQKSIDSFLEVLSDESQVLVKFEDFPTKKLEALRAAAALYCKLDLIVINLKNWEVVPPLEQLLSKFDCYFTKVKVELDALERIKDEEAKKFKSQNIDFDFNMLTMIKELMVSVSSSCLELALKERREAKAATMSKEKNDRKINEQEKGSVKMLWRAFKLAFRVYSFAGGQDDRADKLTRELANEILAHSPNL